MGAGERAAWLRPIIRRAGRNRWHRKHHLMYVGKRLCISCKVSDRNMNLMKEEDCQPARRNFKHRTSYIEMRGIREKRGTVAQQSN